MTCPRFAPLVGMFFVVEAACGQLPNPIPIEWQKGFGSVRVEDACGVRQVPNGDFIVVGTSESSFGGNKTSPHYGQWDFWSLRLDPQGEILSQRTDGGSRMELLYDVVAMPDGGYLMLGMSDSYHDGNKTNDNGGLLHDPWFVRVDANGNKLWDREIPAGWFPVARLTSDGGLILGGQVRSAQRNWDYAVWRLDSEANQVWVRSFGGTGSDQLRSVQQTSDGGYVLAGGSNSGVNGEKTAANLGGSDFWLVRLDSDGNKLWDRTYGGTGDDSARAVRETAEGGFILAGSSSSPSDLNKVSPSFGSNDFWFVAVNAQGDKLWDRAYGGSGMDAVNAFDLLADGGFIAGGSSDSPADGNKTAPLFGTWDGWIVRLDSSGRKLWDQTFGGGGIDAIGTVQQTGDGGFILGVSTLSGADGNKTTAAFGGGDLWVIKLTSEGPRLDWRTNDGVSWRLVLQGISNQTYRTEVSSNLVNWVPFRTNRVDGAGVVVLESTIDATPQRFFRARTQ